jgi:hypothetical protein
VRPAGRTTIKKRAIGPLSLFGGTANPTG